MNNLQCRAFCEHNSSIYLSNFIRGSMEQRAEKSMEHEQTQTTPQPQAKTTRRDFLYLTATSMGIVGAGAALLPFIKSLNPAADTEALASTEVDIASIAPGQQLTVMWRGKPVFIRHRTEAEIAAAKQADLKTLPDPEQDSERVQNPEWLVVVGVCTHLGCIPTAREGKMSGADGGGWLCACHGSYYDTSGRIRKGPAPKNLEVPGYKFQNNGKSIKIGV